VKTLQTFVIIPAKRLDRAKSRLSTILKPGERRELSLAMLTHVIQSSLEAESVSRVVVVSSDDLILREAKTLGAEVIEDANDLNAAVTKAMSWCARRGATATLTIPSDLPLLQPKDLDEIMNLLGGRRGIVVCPSTDGGTNALLCSPPTLIKPRFGPRSFYRHICEARKRGIPYLTHCSPRVSFDVDIPLDLKRLIVGGTGVYAEMCLRKLLR
jgi:2-phospho-L-lactate guanylyltransferase